MLIKVKDWILRVLSHHWVLEAFWGTHTDIYECRGHFGIRKHIIQLDSFFLNSCPTRYRIHEAISGEGKSPSGNVISDSKGTLFAFAFR
jgi:hypothetical protein